MTGGHFGTSVVANEFYTQSFRQCNARPGCGTRGDAVHPGHPDHRLQRPPAATGGRSDEHILEPSRSKPTTAMTTTEAPTPRPRRPRSTRGCVARVELVRRGRRLPSSSRSCGRSRPSGCSSPRSAPQRDIKPSGWWTALRRPRVHPRNYSEVLFERGRRVSAVTSSTRSSSRSRRCSSRSSSRCSRPTRSPG